MSELGLSFGCVAELLLDLYQTTSSIASLTVKERRSLVAEVQSLLAGTYTLPVRTEPTWTRLPA